MSCTQEPQHNTQHGPIPTGQPSQSGVAGTFSRFLSLLLGFASSLPSFKSFPRSLAKSFIFFLKHILCSPFLAPLLLTLISPHMTSTSLYACPIRTWFIGHCLQLTPPSLTLPAYRLLEPPHSRDALCQVFLTQSLRFCISLTWEVTFYFSNVSIHPSNHRCPHPSVSVSDVPGVMAGMQAP